MTYRVEIDATPCNGYGNCEVAAPEAKPGRVDWACTNRAAVA